MKLKIKKLRKNAVLPNYKHETDTGADLYISAIQYFADEETELIDENSEQRYFTIDPFETIVCYTGISVEFPAGYDMQIRPTSGNSLKTPLRVANSPGTIDSGFRGEIGVIIQNVSLNPFVICKGDKIAQMVFSKHEIADIEIVENLEKSDRGASGWGSTGIAGRKEE